MTLCNNYFCALIVSFGIVIAAGMSLDKSEGNDNGDYLDTFYSVDEIENGRRAAGEDERFTSNRIDNKEEKSEEFKDSRYKWGRNSDLPTIYYPRIG